MALDELAHELFARAAGVEISRVKEISACLAVGLLGRIRSLAPVRSQSLPPSWLKNRGLVDGGFAN